MVPGPEEWTSTKLGCGDGPTAPALTLPTGDRVSLTVESTIYILAKTVGFGIGGTGRITTTVAMFVSSLCRCCFTRRRKVHPLFLAQHDTFDYNCRLGYSLMWEKMHYKDPDKH